MKQEGRSYAELLKTVKTHTQSEKPEARIQAARKTRNGELLLVVEKKEGTTLAFHETIAKEIGVENVRIKRDTMTLHVSDLDALTTKEDIREAFMKIKGDEILGEIVVTLLRPAFGDSQVASVNIPTALARKVLTEERVKIGMVSRRVRERVDIKRCFRCLEIGYMARVCTNEIGGAKSFNCGQIGHRTTECGNDPYCEGYGRKGPRTNNMMCPIFRRVLEKVTREKNRQRRRAWPKGQDKSGETFKAVDTEIKGGK